jgi:hypothetical protein
VRQVQSEGKLKQGDLDISPVSLTTLLPINIRVLFYPAENLSDFFAMLQIHQPGDHDALVLGRPCTMH